MAEEAKRFVAGALLLGADDAAVEEEAVAHPLMADAFLLDPQRVSPDEWQVICAAHTRGWPRKHSTRDQTYQGQRWAYITPTPECTLLYPLGTPRAKQPRYVWTELRPGVMAGVLDDEAERRAQGVRVAFWIARGR